MKHDNKTTLLFLIVFGLIVHSQLLFGQEKQNSRLIVLTDIEADPDDTMSLVRLLLCSNEIDIEGLVATTSCWKKSSVAPESIKQVVEAYRKVQPSLNENEPGFPNADALLKLVKQGLPKYGMEGVGDGKDSEGSDWIVKVLEENDDRPLWISVWGGVNTLAQALHKIVKTQTPAAAGKLIVKLRIYTISDQDDSGNWIRTNFPGLFYIVSPGDDYASTTWSAINTVVDGIDNRSISNDWLARNIQQNHGPLGAAGTYQLYARILVGSDGYNDDSLFYANGFGTKNSTNNSD